jgi:HAD superfamily phosphoserine phosphatase-like hydrolase
MHVAIFDFDGTLISRDSFRIFGHLAAETWWQRLWTDLQAIRLKVTGEENAVYKQRVLKSVWGPKTQEERQAVIDQVRHRILGLAYPSMVRTLRSRGHQKGQTLVVTASPEFYVRPIIDTWKIEAEVHGLKLTKESGDLGVQGMHGPAKANLVRSLFGKERKTDVCVYTDSESDLPLLRLADRAVLVHPSKRLIRSVGQLGTPFEIEHPAVQT